MLVITWVYFLTILLIRRDVEQDPDLLGTALILVVFVTLTWLYFIVSLALKA